MNRLGLDLRVAWRRLRQQPLTTGIAAATLALGIGGCLAMFALTDALLLRPLRFPTPERLVTISDLDPDGSASHVGWATVEDWRQRSQSMVGVAAMSTWMPTATGGTGSGGAELLEGLRVSDGFFSLLGVEAAAGRLFIPAEDVRGNHHVVVLSYGLWQRRFGGERATIGRTLTLNGTDYTIVGVLPASFEPVFGTPGRELADIWAPLAYNNSLAWACRDCRHLRALGRMRPGVTLAAARSELSGLGVALARENPKAYSVPGALVVPLQESLFGAQRPLLFGVLGAVGLVLLMATANIAGLRFAATLPRLGELSVRRSLGARRSDLMRLLVVESALLGGFGALLGLLVAQGAMRVALVFAPASLVRLREASIDGRVLLVALGLTLFSTLLFGTLPALAATRSGGSGGDRRSTSGRQRHRALATLVACDVALGVVLLAGAGLFGRSLERLLDQSPGFRTQQLLTMELSVAGASGESVETSARFYRQLVERVGALPQVASASVASQIPLSGSVDGYGIHAEGLSNDNPALDPTADRYAVLPGYLETMGVPLLAGRTLDSTDRGDAPKVVLLSAAFARRVWPAGEALGKRLRIGGNDGPWWTVVGLVGDVRHQGLEALSPGAVYMPLEQWRDPETSCSLVVRAAGDPLALAGAARAIVRELDNEVAVTRVATMDEMVSSVTAARRFAAELLAAFAGVALLLAALGVHGVVAQAVSARRRELGVRRALGSTDAGVVWLLLRQVLRRASLGAVLGLFGALALGRLVRAQLYSVAPNDPLVLGAVCLALLLVACGAALIPARRALRVEPSEVMRAE